MSLKTFHIIFIIASTALAFGTAVWGIDAAMSRGEGGAILLATLSAFAGVALIFYGYRVRLKFKHLGEL
jgi:hypothetical protein